MPPLPGFSTNPFHNYTDLKHASLTLLRALKPHQSPGGARITLPLSTGTHFDSTAAQLEGYARALWAVGTLLHASLVTQDEYDELLEPYVRGLANGTDPQHEEYWGPVVLRDQRMVEMEIISFALLVAPDRMFYAQDERVRGNIKAWLGSINGKDFPATNWLWFRVLTNLALVKVCGVSYESVGAGMRADLDRMEGFYLGEGWAADGVWGEGGRQADYYSGSFAIQFSQLVYSRLAWDVDPERCERYRGRAREFATSFWRYFDTNGAAIPFGRSLTYRFALAGFWSAVAFAELDLPAPLNDWGVVKGLLLRHFRWWSTKHDIFNVDGTLTIGFTYPNMYMSEDYNSPQSPYWALKSFLALSLPPSHTFWTSREKSLPLPQESHAITPVHPPKHIICASPNHHYLLSTAQFCPWPLKATEAKYGKYAYSSHFGFSVPTGTLIQQIAPDSTLALSKDGGETWRVPWRVDGAGFGEARVLHHGKEVERISVLKSVWRPWGDAEVEVSTWLVAPSKRWPDWYLRVHRFRNTGVGDVKVQCVQGGFAIQGRGDAKGEVLPVLLNTSSLAPSDSGGHSFPEGTLQVPDGALICSNAGASGIRTLHATGIQRAEILKPDANTNLIWQRTLIPTLVSDLTCSNDSTMLACAVFALARTENREEAYAKLDVGALWEDVPVLRDRGEGGAVEWCVTLD